MEQNNKINIYAMYLPQYHVIPENSKFWGEGFTDWVTVKKAQPLFEGHKMPKVPLNDNYYDLSTKEAVKWQADLAKKYGIDGFGIYHYWFSSKHNLLTKPAEIISENPNIDINFFFAWDNTSWKRTWSAVKGNDWAPSMDNGESNAAHTDSGILIEYDLGNQDEWDKHFAFLLPFFKDTRYAKKDNKPIFIIFNYETRLKEMEERWQELARKNGFDGIYIIYREDSLSNIPSNNKFFYQPIYSGWGSAFDRIKNKLKSKMEKDTLLFYSYDKIWNSILKREAKDKDINHYPGAFVSYDDTARRGKRGRVVRGSSPRKFYSYMKKLIGICKTNNKDMIFLTAWNEWSEGAYLEPDEDNKYGYLKALKMAKDS